MLKLNEIVMRHILMLNHCGRISLYQKAKAEFPYGVTLSHSFDYRGILRSTETGKRLVFDKNVLFFLSAVGC